MGECPFRIGFGYDVHALAPQRRLVLGGEFIPHHVGLAGHSDADVLLHAVCDALLGAAALGDIGKWFPPSDKTFEDIDSRILLRRTITILHQEGFSVVNIDSTIAAEEPKLSPYIDAMRRHIAEDCVLPMEAVSVKATTTEKLGFIGRKEGVEAYATVLITRNK